MKKTKAARSKNEDKPKAPAEKPKPAREEETHEADNRFDFGGIPGRDLKKNLGCG
jgi:hypothetical protein